MRKGDVNAVNADYGGVVRAGKNLRYRNVHHSRRAQAERRTSLTGHAPEEYIGRAIERLHKRNRFVVYFPYRGFETRRYANRKGGTLADLT